jgi:hypothetical protein
MADERVEVVGAERFAATARTAARKLDQLAPDAAGRLVALRGRSEAPRRSGRLAGSVTAGTDGGDVTVSSRLIYAGVIHNGWPGHNISANPFLARALTSSKGEIQRTYTADAQDALSHIKGV